MHSNAAEGIMFQCSAKVINRCDKMGLGDLPVTHCARLGREAATDLENLSRVGRILGSVAFILNLLESIFGCAV